MILNAIIIIIYYITVWGENLIKIVNKKSLESTLLIDKLDGLLLNINKLTNDLENNMETFSGCSEGVNCSSQDKRESIDQINIRVQEIVKSISAIKTEFEEKENIIEEQTSYTKGINEMMNKARKLT